ncbi:MAG: alpha/beta fold hydrolase [Candidatus Dormibacteraeota bacterium]|nr:alpha/beta fold hydrolase [Candidatus Dormibacteraeota bacterium]
MPDFDADGLRIHYVTAGDPEARPILLVHGYASDYELNWVGSRWQETLTGQGFRVVGIDLRGHGHSEKPHDPGSYSLRAMAGDALRLLDHLGLERVDLLGYSMGARIGLLLCHDEPERVGRAVIAGIGLRQGTSANPAKAQLIARRMRGDTTVEDPEAVMFYNFASARPSNDLEALACCILGDHAALRPEQLASVRTPIDVIAGDQDLIAGDAPELAARLPHARYDPIPGRTHNNAVPARDFKAAAVPFLLGER